MVAGVPAPGREPLCGVDAAPESNAKATSSQVSAAAIPAAATSSPIRCPRRISSVTGWDMEAFTTTPPFSLDDCFPTHGFVTVGLGCIQLGPPRPPSRQGVPLRKPLTFARAIARLEVSPESGQYPLVVGERTAPLLEREEQLALIDRLLGAAREGHGTFLLLEGPAGIGKSRLLGATCDDAEARELQVLRARGGELERDFSFGVVRQVFEARLASCTEDERVRLLAGAAHLAGPLFDFGEAGGALARGENASHATLHGLFWLTVNLAELGPTLLAVDDLHWCDPPSLRFLSYLAHRLDGLPVIVAACVRTGEPGVEQAVMTALESEPLTMLVRPAPLSRDAVAQLLRAKLASDPAPEFVQVVHASCAGNPFLLNELVHALLAERIEPTSNAAERIPELGPESLSRFVLQRLRRIGASAEALARAVAILGQESELGVASQLAKLSTEEATEMTAELVRSDVFRPRSPLAFAHPVLQAAVYADLSGPERELGHERAAELLMEAGAAPERVAAHLLHVSPQGRAAVVATLREAARRASGEGAADVAKSYLERALTEPPDPSDRADVLSELGSAELSSGLPGAVGHLEEAYELLQGQPRSAEVALALANAHFAEDVDLFEAADGLRRTIESLDPHDAALAQRLEAELITWARFDARLYPMARARLARLVDRASDDTLGGRFVLGLMASELARTGKSPEKARQLVERALAGGLLLGDESWTPFVVAVAVLLSLDELDAAVRLFTDWLELARRRGSAFAFSHASSFRAMAMLRRGELAEAEADARAALDAALPFAFTYALLAEALVERGELAEAIRTLDLAGVPEEGQPSYQMAVLLEPRARLRIARGEVEQGLADLLAAGEHLESFGIRNPSYSAWRSDAALALLGLGDRREARRLVEEEVELARRWGTARPLGVALRVAGLVEGGDDGVELLRESVSVLATSQARLERAKSLTELGAALRRANQRASARTILREGLELAHQCGAVVLGERAHTELLATGARPRRLVRSGVDSLTPSERRIAQMATEGQTNREIAQALFVTPKTVETHLSHVYRKLGIQARSQLPETMSARRSRYEG
jgi:DNA-binding CsgD family transcriptional regulator